MQALETAFKEKLETTFFKFLQQHHVSFSSFNLFEKYFYFLNQHLTKWNLYIRTKLKEVQRIFVSFTH